jgi:hypothetical protein
MAEKQKQRQNDWPYRWYSPVFLVAIAIAWALGWMLH